MSIAHQGSFHVRLSCREAERDVFQNGGNPVHRAVIPTGFQVASPISMVSSITQSSGAGHSGPKFELTDCVMEELCGFPPAEFHTLLVLQTLYHCVCRLEAPARNINIVCEAKQVSKY